MMASAQVVVTSVNVTSNSPSQDYTHPDDHTLPNYDDTLKCWQTKKYKTGTYRDYILGYFIQFI